MESKLPDFDALLVELEHLERRERELSDFRRLLHARLNSFPNELTARREREVSAERIELHRRIDELRAILRPILRQPEPPPTVPRLGA
jgi:hypothetical protein